MGLNLELKIRGEINKVKQLLLNELGGEFVDTLFQKDTYYKYSNGLVKLREQNGDFSMIKYNREEEEIDRWSKYSILKLLGENIEDFFNEILILEVCVEKKRDLYLYKNTRIHLDIVNDLGEFIELETVSDNLSESEAKIEFENVVKVLELDKQKEIRKSYRDLLFKN